ncbi:universal stress protein [Halorarius litoreus]|uniref:universal stress protein n=1 Tax=Halorarius litoreus TaxID=2962676 RepID=UPI0020CDA5B8|nr:universal stress protein [Halorarius litoreus]
MRYDTILVPYDGSDGANRAVEHAFDLAQQYDATVHALFVVDTRSFGEPALSSVELVVDEVEDEGHRLLDAVADRAEAQGVQFESLLRHGVPHDEVVARATDIDADLVIMGFHGRTHDSRIGSVVERVVRDGGRPVLVA